MNLIPQYQNVISWNDFSGNKINDTTKQPLYINLTKEESDEINDSVRDNIPVELLDGLCDTLVVGSFLLALKNGKNLDDHIVDLALVDISQLEIQLDLLDKLKEEGIFLNIEKILSLVERICASLDFDTVAAFEEVMDSNWSKFPLIELVDPEQEVIYIESQKRYKNVTYFIKVDESGKKRYVFKDGNSKVVKPSTFRDPSLSRFLTPQILNLSLFKK